MKISKKWRKMGELYKQFCPKEECYSFNETSAERMFLFESTGHPKMNLTDKDDNGKFNGFLVGKHWMDATIKMWREDIENGLLLKSELEKDFPEWFLNKII